LAVGSAACPVQFWWAAVAVVESLSAGFVSGTYKDVYAFILLIVVLLVKPSGILGVEAKLKALICVTQSGLADDQVAAYEAPFLRWGRRFQTRSL
jgi:hypothetical protein